MDFIKEQELAKNWECSTTKNGTEEIHKNIVYQNNDAHDLVLEAITRSIGYTNLELHTEQDGTGHIYTFDGSKKIGHDLEPGESDYTDLRETFIYANSTYEIIEKIKMVFTRYQYKSSPGGSIINPKYEVKLLKTEHLETHTCRLINTNIDRN
jgi:hypothetical protein